MLRRDIEHEILPFCKENNIGVIVYSPMESGLLSGKMTRERITNLEADDWRSRNARFKEPQLSRNLELVEILRAIGQRYGRSPAEVAIAWTLGHPTVTGAIVGARNADQVDGFIQAVDFRLEQQDLAQIDKFIAVQ